MKLVGIWLLSILTVFSSAAVLADGPLRIGTNLWPGYEPLYLARELGYLNPQRVQLNEYPSATDVLRAFRDDALDAAALTLDEVLTLREAGIPVKVALVMDISDGGDVILAHPLIARFQDLKGKRIAVESGALGAYMITRALELNDMELRNILIVHLDVDEHEKAYLNGRVDAAVTFEPVRTRLLATGAREVFTSKEIPGEIVDVLVIHERVLNKEYEPAAEELIKGWFDALTYLQNNPEEASQLIGKRLGISAEDALASFEGLKLPNIDQNIEMLGGAEPGLKKTLNRLEAAMLKNHLLISPMGTEGILTPALLQ
jgi:NitT/TauT family transport system substrate-binding protein